MFWQQTPHLKELSLITDPPSPSLLLEMSSQIKKSIKVEDIESTLPIALPRQEPSRSNCMTAVIIMIGLSNFSVFMVYLALSVNLKAAASCRDQN